MHLREALGYQIRCFFTHCVNGPWPPPSPRFTQSCCEFFDINVKKCVNVCRDKIWHNSAKICGQNVKFTLKLWQFYPWKYFFVPILCCQKASRIIQIRNINFYTWESSRSQVHCHYPSLSFASKLSWFIIITTWHSISPTIFRSWPLLQSSTIDQIPLSLWHQEFPLIWYNWTFKYNWTLTIAHWT